MFGQKKQTQDFAVIGLGRFGTSVARTLEEHGHAVLGIDLDHSLVQQIAGVITQAVVLDSTDEEALKAVDISEFETVIVAIGTDFEANLLTATALKDLGVRRVIAKAQTPRQREILLRVGADRVIRPEDAAGRRLAEELSAPAMLEKLPLGPQHSVLELTVPHKLAWQTLAQSNLRAEYGITVLVVKRGEEILVSPPADCVLQENDILVVLGDNTAVTAFARLT